ncbi:carboxylesterase family protein [Streptomyces sp. NPDC051218]|uniref:carboxylesterase family protein n=1 Tax=Streptomyces sp. NPDC051218 TaxID=3365645 RepID=UPI003798C10E
MGSAPADWPAIVTLAGSPPYAAMRAATQRRAGFSSGAGLLDWYDGGALAAQGDVVVVGVNYRLGALGYLCLDSARATSVCTTNWWLSRGGQISPLEVRRPGAWAGGPARRPSP